MADRVSWSLLACLARPLTMRVAMEHEPLTAETLAAAVVAAPPEPPNRAAVVPVRLTRGERDQLAEVSRDMGGSVSRGWAASC